MRTLILISALTLLTGCQLIDGPSPMPTGYKYHNKPYHSAPGPQARHGSNHEHVNQSAPSVENTQSSPVNLTPVYEEPAMTSAPYDMRDDYK